MKVWIFMLFSVLMLVSGCASVKSPTAETIDGLQIIRFGEAVPDNGAYVLHFPAGVAVDTPVNFGGNLFRGEDTKRLRVILKQDIYAYKDWISFDRKQWFVGEEKL